MQRYLAASAIVLLIGVVWFRVLLMRGAVRSRILPSDFDSAATAGYAQTLALYRTRAELPASVHSSPRTRIR